MKITFLAARAPLVKSFALQNGQIEKTSYPLTKYFTSYEYDVLDLGAMYEVIKAHAEQGHCLLKGNVKKPLKDAQRAGSTSPAEQTQWLCFDIDGVKDVDIEYAIKSLPPEYHDVSYIVQDSASMGITDDSLRAHIFMLLDEPILPATLKTYTHSLNFHVPLLRNNIRLSRTGNALSYPLDPTTAQNDKLLYIAPPVLGRGVADGFVGERIQLVEKKNKHLKLNLNAVNASNIRGETLDVLNELRTNQGLSKKRKHEERVFKHTTVVRATDQAQITGIKEERGFVYLNLNGGDSWGYYHPADDAEVLYNFKHEPNYLIKELLPGYYAEARKQAKQAKQESAETRRKEMAEQNNEDHTTYFTGLNRRTTEYFKASYNTDTDFLDLVFSKKLHPILNFQRLHGLEVTQELDEWDFAFDPTSTKRVDFDTCTANIFTPTQYMLNPKPSPGGVPPTIHKFLWHAVGNDQMMYDHFLNWLATIFQTRIKTGVAWILQGTQGTGKGLFWEHVVRPLFGQHQCIRLASKNLESSFNGQTERAIMVLFDEMDSRNMKKMFGAADGRFKELITEPTLAVRRMFTEEYTVESFLNILIFSNDPVPVLPSHDDRRFNVCPRQETPIEKPTEEEIARMKEEVAEFAGFLSEYKIDVVQARTAVNNEAKARIQELSLNAAEDVAKHIREGNLGWFIEMAPDIERPYDMKDRLHRELPGYKQTLIEIHDSATRGAGNISRDHAQVLMFYLANLTRETPHQFTKVLARLGLPTKQGRVNNVKTVVIHTIRNWVITEEDTQIIEEWRTDLATEDTEKSTERSKVVPLKQAK